jgi:hypothetical protein
MTNFYRGFSAPLRRRNPCSQHDPDSQGARKCMRANGPSLFKACLDALIAAGEVSREEVARRDRRK